MVELTLRATGSGAELAPLDHAGACAVTEQFRDLVGEISQHNQGNRAWWYCWLSSRDANHTPLLGQMLWLARLDRHLAGTESITLVCVDPVLAQLVAKRARARGWRVKVDAASRLRWLGLRVRACVRPLEDAAKAAAVGWLSWRAARRHPQAATELYGNDVILVGWLDRRLLARKPGPYLDVYYGPLAAMLQDAGERCLHMGPLMAEPREFAAITAAAVAVTEARLSPMGHWLRLGDIGLAAVQALLGRVRLPDSVDAPALVRAALFRRTLYDAQARLFERALSRALAANPAARVIHLYENLPWERAVNLAAHAHGRHALGYLHCAVVPSFLTFFTDEGDQRVRPQPDRIACTGPAAREVLLSLGRHDPAKVVGGMALRGPDPAGLTMRTDRPRRIRTVLVLLEGLYKMVDLLRWLDRVVKLASPDVRFVLRAHPMLPLPVLAEAAGVKAGPGQRLEPSTNPSLEADIAAADIILYQGTTAALTAGLMGVPLLCFDAGQALPDDPLLRCSAFKRVVADPADLIKCIGELEALDDAAWQAEKNALRDYVTGYLRAPSVAALADFRVALTSHPAAD